MASRCAVARILKYIMLNGTVSDADIYCEMRRPLSLELHEVIELTSNLEEQGILRFASCSGKIYRFKANRNAAMDAYPEINLDAKDNS